MESLLIVDDEAVIRHALEKYFRQAGFEVFSAGDGEAALQLLESKDIAVAIIDLVMPKLDGLTLLHRLRVRSPRTLPIVLTGFGTITSAVEVMRAGAYHYLTKPFQLEDIGAMVRKGLAHRANQQKGLAAKAAAEPVRFENILGKSPVMHQVFQLIEKVMETDSTVLILGESGTGKELVAKAIHFNSPRKDRPMITVNCAAIPETLLESELFGYMKGAFTGAYETTAGKFTAADGGTIFLDEIGEMSPQLQVKLLRVLQERKFEPIGSTQPQSVDVRIITATNRDLEEAVKEGKFREDLYYRLHVIPISLPPLRERPEDIPLLADHFIDKCARAHDKRVPGLTEEAKKLFLQYPWPGNVRELANTLERIILLKEEGPIEAKDLPPQIRGEIPQHKPFGEIRIPDTGLSFRKALSGFEDSLILKALEKTGGNKNQAASLLKINRTTLVEKIKKKGLEKLLGKEGGAKNV